MERTPAYYWGLGVGLALAIALVALVRRVAMGKRTKERRAYDERQQQALGKAYKCGYYTLLIYLCAVALFDLMTGIRWCSLYTGAFLGTLLSVGVFGVVGIWLDAYYPFRESPKRYILLFTVLGVMNVIIGVVHYRDAGTFIEDGVLSHAIVNPLAGALLLLLAAAMAVKDARDKRARETEERG